MRHQTEKTIITVETFQHTVVRLRRKAKVALCEQCAAETVMITPSEAAALCQTTEREIFRCVEESRLHFWETADGALLVCQNSLLSSAEEKKS
jgi:hypothetical protein